MGRIASAIGVLTCACLLPNAALADVKGNCGTIVLPKGADINSFNPVYASTLYNAQAASLMFEQLIWINRYYKIDWARSVASAITSPDEGTTYNVTLRSWHWSDGVPVTAGDVAYTLKLIREMGPYYPGYGSGGMPDIIKTFTIIDPTHFQIVLTHQVNPLWFEYNGLSALQPLPEHSWSHYTLDQIYQNQSNPEFFNVVDSVARVSQLNVGQDIIFLPNPSYEGPKPHFTRLVFSFLNNDGAAIQGVQAGELDLSVLPDSLWSVLKTLHGIYTVDFNDDSIGAYILNFHNPNVAFFRDVRVRQAIQDAMDQRAIINLIYHGLGDPEYGPIAPEPPDFLSPAMKAGHYPVGFNLPHARALLAAAGFTPGPDGIMQKNGKRLSFTLIITSDADEELAIIFQQQERAASIEVKVRNMEFNDMIHKMESADPTAWEAASEGFSGAAYPTGEQLFETGGGDNNAGYSDPKMDALINASVSKPGLDGLYAYEDYAAAQQPMIFLPDTFTPWLVADRLHGVPDYEDTLLQITPDQLYCTAP